MESSPGIASGALPAPPPEAAAHSARLIAVIRQRLEAAGGAIPFDEFMAQALYEPGLGYYSAGTRKFGEAGDFVTAPEISPLFAAALARQCEPLLAATAGEILEFGAGTGALAADLLLALERRAAMPVRYQILELSGELRQRQQETLTTRAPHLLERVTWRDALPERFDGVILANEVLDAMPVKRFRLTTDGVAELGVVWRGERFDWSLLPATDPALRDRAEHLRSAHSLDEGYESEVGLAAERWTRDLGRFLTRGAALLIDYGFPRHEFYHPQRAGGTLMCHYRHRSHGDPFYLPGLQDITAHVDFTAIAEAAAAGGLHVAGFATQANFLLAGGLAELAAEAAATDPLGTANAVKRLTMPGEMGELFKVIALTRGLEPPLRGFALRDERARL